MTPLLSICIPTHNRGPWLAGRIRAWLAAVPSGRIEIVVSDNASTDGTADCVGEISDPRLRVIRNAEDVGAFENQLRAFEAARGKYLMQLMDKDDLLPSGFAGALAELERLDVACGDFTLNGFRAEGTTVRRGFRAFRRHALQFTHPSGRFLSSAVLREFGLLERLRGLDPVARPYSTDYLVTLALAHGAYATVDVPFVRMNLPPYEGIEASFSYRDPEKYYFTPEFLSREFAEYVRFLRREAVLPVWSRLRLVAHLAGGTVFDQMTAWYRWRLGSEAICGWYGVRPDFRARELKRELDLESAALLRGLGGIGRLDALAVRLGLARRLRRGERREVPARIAGRTDRPLVSVLMPAYNHGKYVAEAIRSVIAQDWRRIELIVVDDGSRDDTWEVLQSLRSACEARFERTVMLHQENRGTCATLGRLFAEARGEFVGILASDDMYRPAAISALLEPLLADSGIGLAVGQNELMDDAGRTCYWDALRNVTYDPEKAKYRSLNEQMASEHGVSGFHPGFGTYVELLRGNHIANGALIRKSCLDAIEPCSAETPLEDWWIMLQLAKATRMVSVEAATFRYRWHATNTVRNADRMMDYYYRNLEAEERLLFRRRDWSRLDEYLDVYGARRRRHGIRWILRRNRHTTRTSRIVVYELFGFRLRFLHPDLNCRKEWYER